MRRHSFPTGIFAISLLAGAAPAQAAMQTWVAGNGNNSGNCPISAPCKTFVYAHNHTSPGGVINVLSSGNFGPVTISKAISIVAQGVEAVISTAAGGAGVIVQAGVSDIVLLRGMTIDLGGTDNDGISFVSGAALQVHDTVIRKTSDGIRFAPALGTPELYVADSLIMDTTTTGILVMPSSSAGTNAVLDRVRVERGAGGGIGFTGSDTTGAIVATVRDSVVAGHGNTGIYAEEIGTGTTRVMIDRTASVNNNHGIVASNAGATIRIGRSTVSGNTTTGLFNSGGTLESYGTNKVHGNGTDGTPSSIAMQ